MKKLISLLITVTMLCGMLGTVGFAAGITPSANLISVAYSEKLDLYVTVAADGQLYTSGDGLSWAPGAKLAPSTNLGTIVGNSYYVTPDAVIWNPDLKEFVVAAGDKLYRSTDGFNWGDAITPKAGDNTLVIHTLFWDGSKYWAATTTGGQVAYAADNTLTSWSAKSLGSGTQRPIDGFAKSSDGKLFACTSVNNAKTLYYTVDGSTWTDGTVNGTTPYRTTSIQYSKKLSKILLAGGNASNNASTANAAISRADVATGLTEAKLELKADANNSSPLIPVISDFVVYDTYNSETNAITKEDIIAVSYTGAINYRSVGDASDITKNRKWKEVPPASGVTANTVGLTAVIHGKGGYVAVGGDPSNHDRTSLSGAVAIFIPDDYTQGYKVGSFDDNATPVAKSLIVSGEDEIGIPAGGAVTSQYTATVRDIAGKPIQNAANTIVWSVSGANTEGISIQNGVLSVSPLAQAQQIVIKAADSEDATICGEKVVLIADSAAPTSIQVSGPASLVKSELNERTATYSARVLDQLGRDVPAGTGMENVAWSLSYPEEDAASGLSIDAGTGVLSVPATAAAGYVNVVATSTYTGYETVLQEYQVRISTIASVTISGPANYYHYFKQCTNTPCTYTFAPAVEDDAGNPITEECEYAIAEAHNNPGVSMSKSAKGECVISLSKNAVSDTLTLVATVKEAPEVTGTFELNIVDTMVPNGDLYEANTEGNIPLNWTNVGTLAPTSLGTSENHGRWIFNITSASAEDYVSYQSDMFAVAANATYKFGFRSAGVKVPEHNDDYMPLLYMMVTFTDASGEMVGEPVLIFDTYISDGKAHSTAMDFYQEVKAPANAVNAQVTMTATPPVEFNLYDIGCYPLIDSGNISITGESSVEAGNSLKLTATTENLMYNEQSISLPDGVRWYLKNNYSGVSVDEKTGELTVSKNAKAGNVKVVAVVSGNSAIAAEKEIEIVVKELVVNELKVSDTIAAGSDVSAQAKIYNSTDNSALVNVFVAVYSAEGVLEYCGISETTEIANDKTEKEISAYVTVPSGVNTDGWFAKAFVWNNLIPVQQK